MIRNNDNNDNDDDEDRRQFYLERLEYWEKFMKSKAAGCGSISTLISSIVLLCISSIVIIFLEFLENHYQISTSSSL